MENLNTQKNECFLQRLEKGRQEQYESKMTKSIFVSFATVSKLNNFLNSHQQVERLYIKHLKISSKSELSRLNLPFNLKLFMIHKITIQIINVDQKQEYFEGLHTSHYSKKYELVDEVMDHEIYTTGADKLFKIPYKCKFKVIKVKYYDGCYEYYKIDYDYRYISVYNAKYKSIKQVDTSKLRKYNNRFIMHGDV